MSAFLNRLPQFEAFLLRVKDDAAMDPGRSGAQQNARFIARNFLLEEHLEDSRVLNYAADLPNSGQVDFEQWNAAHNQYLKEHIFVTPPATHDYRLVSRINPAICPETFRTELALIPFHGTDLDTHLIRIVPVSDCAYLSGEREDLIFSLGEKVLLNPNRSNPDYRKLESIFDNAFSGARCDHRPVFAAFYEDFVDDLRLPFNRSWPDQLRNRLGLYHINQWQPGGLPRRVFLFRYSVRELPRHSGDPARRPLAIPVVLDHRLSEAFCPAPRELDRGRLLNLETNAIQEPAREVLHLFMPMQVDHLFRVGLVTTPVPEDLMSARRDHLIWMRLQANREGYASDTDTDLF